MSQTNTHLEQKPSKGKDEPYFSMYLPNPKSSIFERQVVSLGLISWPTISLICKEKKKKYLLSETELSNRHPCNDGIFVICAVQYCSH